MQGAVAGMIVGLAFTAIYIYYFKIGGGIGKTDQYLWDISPEGIGTIGMLINLVISLVVSRLTPAPPAEVQALVEEIRVPRGSGAAAVH